jgi:uncharacterized membrane protein
LHIALLPYNGNADSFERWSRGIRGSHAIDDGKAAVMQREPGTRWIVRFGAMQRLGTALGVAMIAAFVQPDAISWHMRIVASWDLAALAYLALAWTLIARADAKVTREHALSQDQSGYLIFLFVVGASCASIVAIGFVVGTIRDLPFWVRAWHLAITSVALASSWLLIQTVFAFHYAHRYYAGPHHEPSTGAPLLFPGGREPDYADFAYYSFVVGMTSQVSDVAVASRRMRRLTMIHGVLAFLFNIAVLALSINIIASVI